MKYLKITFAIIAIMAYGQSHAQGVKPMLKKKFEKIDSNSNKTISLEELTTFHKGKVNKKGTPINANKVFANKDANNDGKITLKEFAKKIAAKGNKKPNAKGRKKFANKKPLTRKEERQKRRKKRRQKRNNRN